MKVGDIVGHPASKFAYSEDSKNWVAPRLEIGLEIEIENPKGQHIDNRLLAPYWRMEEDGSLRDRGFELVLDQPLFGKDLTSAVNCAYDFFEKHKTLEVNYRTGLHVHCDSRNLDVPELQRFFVLYALFEASIFNFVGDNRNTSNFCAPWGRVSDHLEKVFSIFDPSSTKEDTRLALRGIDRYSALNCNALHKYGSLEFRHMQMTKDFDKIRNWINVVMCLHNASRFDAGTGPNVPTEVLVHEASKGGAYNIARRIFPEWFLQHVNDKAIWDGILLVKEVSTDIQQKHSFKQQSLAEKICPEKGDPRGFQQFMSKV